MSGLDGFTATGRTGAVDQVIAYVRYAVKMEPIMWATSCQMKVSWQLRLGWVALP